jgi:glycosyltransferase involved in cell wall biosynthesis
MKENSIKVSVIIPTYKREVKYLSRAIDSLKSQTHSETEIVVVDDNPKESLHRDATEKFMELYRDDSKVIYYKNPQNVGGSLARNNGIGVATGEYITFLDDDDEYLPGKIEKQLKFMLSNDYDMSFTNLKLVNEYKVVVDFREYTWVKSFDKKSLLKYHLMKHLTGTPTFMYRIEKLKEVGCFEDAKMGQEFYLMLKSIEGGLKIGYLNDCDVIAYRHNDGGISQGRNKIKGELSLYNFKRKYFSVFNMREKMFIRFRHYAVMTIAYKRNGDYIRTLGSATKMILSSPGDFISELVKFVFNITKNRRLG